MRKLLKLKPGGEPIMILGGSPISVAVPPILEAITSANRNGNGAICNSRVTASVTGATSSTVRDIVEDRGDEERHELNEQQEHRRMRAGELRRADGGILKHARALRDRGDDHQPGQRADGVPVDALERLGLIERAGQHRDAGGDQRDDGAVDPVPDDDRIGDAQQDASKTTSGRGRK